MLDVFESGYEVLNRIFDHLDHLLLQTHSVSRNIVHDANYDGFRRFRKGRAHFTSGMKRNISHKIGGYKRRGFDTRHIFRGDRLVFPVH